MSENINEDSNKEICPYCQKEIEDKLFDDHMMCHEIQNEEQKNNNINQPGNNNNNNDLNNVNNNIGNNNSNNNVNNNGNNENIFSKFINMISSSVSQNNSNNNNESNNQNRQNNQSSSSSNNNNDSNSFGFLSGLFGQASNNNNNSNNQENRNNHNSSGNNITNALLSGLFSTFSKTVSGLTRLTSEFVHGSSNQNENEENAPPPPNDFQYIFNGNNLPPNFIIPPNNPNIQILPPIIIGQRGMVYYPFQQQNQINIDEIMNLLPSSVVNEKKEGENNNCIICLNDFDIGENITSLPCLHVFHTDCIKHWLQSNNHCPVCKLTITKESLQGGN